MLIIRRSKKKVVRSCVLLFKNEAFFFLKYQKPVNFLAGFIGLKKLQAKKRPDPTLL